MEQFIKGSAVFRVTGHFSTPPENWTVRAFLQLTPRLSNDFTAAWLTFTFPQLFAVAATLKSIHYNVAMTFILNNNNCHWHCGHATKGQQICKIGMPGASILKWWSNCVNEVCGSVLCCWQHLHCDKKQSTMFGVRLWRDITSLWGCPYTCPWSRVVPVPKTSYECAMPIIIIVTFL